MEMLNELNTANRTFRSFS